MTANPKTILPNPQFTPLPNRMSFEIRVHVDYIRVATYLFFWSFVFLTMFFRKFYDEPQLAEGVEGRPNETLGCGPFNRDNDKTTWPTNDFNLSYGEGFSWNQNHLTEAFGFPNICTNWDYDISRTWSNYYFPFFEYSMVLYIALNTVQDFVLYKRGYIPKWCMHLQIFITFVCMWCAIFFRGIFVYRAYEQTRHHTFGFLTLQVALMTIAIQNTITVINTKQYYPEFKWLNTPEKVARAAKWYLYPNLMISAVKIYATFYIVAGLHPEYPSYGPEFYKIKVFGGWVLGKYIDLVWMAFNAILPLFIAYFRGKYEDPIIITFQPPDYGTHDSVRHDHSDENRASESTPLNPP